jgi:hypothetical protein
MNSCAREIDAPGFYCRKLKSLIHLVDGRVLRLESLA